MIREAGPLIGVCNFESLTARKHYKHYLMSKLSITPDVKIAKMLQLACMSESKVGQPGWARNELCKARWASSNRPKINLELSVQHFKHSQSSLNTPGSHYIYIYNLMLPSKRIYFKLSWWFQHTEQIETKKKVTSIKPTNLQLLADKIFIWNAQINIVQNLCERAKVCGLLHFFPGEFCTYNNSVCSQQATLFVPLIHVKYMYNMLVLK